ncbi:MAG: hypothetical protein ABEH81_01140 [Halopenitus sp.]
MGDKPYDDGEKLAKARWAGGEEHSYEEMAKHFDCSPGTISLRFNHPEHYGVAEELEKYGPEDFIDEDDEIDIEEDDDSPDLPYDFDLPEDWPPDQDTVDEYFAPGVDINVALDEAEWGCKRCLPRLRKLFNDEYGVDPLEQVGG